VAENESHLFPKGGRNFSFHSGDTNYLSREELASALQQFSERMPFQREFISSPSDTSQISSSSLGLYTPNSDLNLFEQSFSTSLAESDPGLIPYNDEQLGPFQGDPQIPSAYAWFSESRSPALVSVFPGTPVVQEKDTRGSLRETTLINAPHLPFENFNTPPQTAFAALNSTQFAEEYTQTFDTAKTQPNTRNRGSKNRKPSKSFERRPSSPKLRTADHARSPTSPTMANTTTNLKRAHNMVEKQYRNRLNGHFASLLSKIPLELALSTGLDTIGGGKNVSKAETLILAERYIKILQDEERELLKKNERLEEDYERLKRAWINSGGVLIP